MNISSKNIVATVSWPRNVINPGCQLDVFADGIELYANMSSLTGKAHNWRMWLRGEEVPAKGELFNRVRKAAQRNLYQRGYRI